MIKFSNAKKETQEVITNFKNSGPGAIRNKIVNAKNQLND